MGNRAVIIASKSCDEEEIESAEVPCAGYEVLKVEFIRGI